MPILLVTSALASSIWLSDVSPTLRLEFGSVIGRDRLGYSHIKTRFPDALKVELRSAGGKVVFPISFQRLNRNNLASVRAYRKMLENAPARGNGDELPGEQLGAQEYFLETRPVRPGTNPEVAYSEAIMQRDRLPVAQ
ncbi:MAG: hypothetical protein ABL949_00905 [Fimbriimonadaceae bacterium]